MEAVIGSICILFGAAGFFLSFAGSSSNESETFYAAKAINHINGIAVDADGNFYIGNEEGGYIQAFNGDGIFLYGFSFATGGGSFTFAVDKENVVHIVAARTNRYFEYKDGSLASTQKIDAAQSDSIIKSLNLSSGNTCFGHTGADHAIKYKLDSFHNVRIYDQAGHLVKTVALEAPWLPLSMFSDWLIGLLGAGLWLCRLGPRKIRQFIKEKKHFRGGYVFYGEHNLRKRKH